ncbi:MAG: site-specific DNA-methyltransferase [Acidobacteria bacterium]|nr:site-specific DNA-methyltransferase [Acidobacteriota bacterium]
MNKKQKLELTWIGKENRPRLEPRILLEDADKSYHAPHRVTDNDLFDNRLIFGDNLLALKALEQEFTGKIKCIFIDPPYNTGSAFDQYDDGIEHSIWLALIRDRLEILSRLLTPDGSLWISLDDNEAHYMKVLGDEVFGRGCFIADIAWQKRDGPPNDRKIGSIYDHILVWGKTKPGTSKKTLAEESFNLMPRTEKADAQYQVFSEPDGPDPRGPFRKIDTTANGKGGRFVESLFYPILNPYTGEEVWPRKGTCWRHSKDEMARLQADKRLYWGVKGAATTPMRKLFKSEAKQGMTAPSIWTDTGLNQHASGHLEELFGEKAAFETPKPEELLSRIIHIATNPGEIVFDSFAGSGTTGAAAHKMGRRWFMIEVGEHCHTLIIPRLKKVIDGEDPGGITQAVNWQGGGGFRYFRLAPSLLEKDKWGNWVINKEYNAAMLAEALCKLEGFSYAPSETIYWQHGHSTERDFIYITTANLNHAQLQELADEVGPERSLLVLCTAFRAKANAYPNLTIKKIPKQVLSRCEWGHDDYSLKVENLPKAPPKPGQQALFGEEEGR